MKRRNISWKILTPGIILKSFMKEQSKIAAKLKPAPVKKIMIRLKQAYGERKRTSRPDAVGVLVQTILSQNTSDLNSGRAYGSLLQKFKNWDAVSGATLNSISKAIIHGGLADVKAKYIKDSLQEIKRRRGSLELDFLKELPLHEALKWLTSLPGVGLKTANVVLLFSLGMPAVPVDTHIFRVSKRLGLIDEKLTLEKAHRELGKIVPEEDAYPFHLLMIEHGRRTCHSRHPECAGCVLRDICPGAGLFMK
jgi:endonuclease III